MNLEIAQNNMQNLSLLWLYVIYVNSTHFYAVRNPFWNNAIDNTFRKLNTYIIAKHTLANQLVLTFYRRVTPVFNEFHSELARQCWWVQVASVPVNSPDVAFLSAQSMREDKQLAWTSDCLFSRTNCCLCTRSSAWASLSLVADNHAGNVTSLCKYVTFPLAKRLLQREIGEVGGAFLPFFLA